MGDAVRAKAPIPLINAGYIADDMISTSPALSYATTYSKERINTFDPFATLPGLSSNATCGLAPMALISGDGEFV